MKKEELLKKYKVLKLNKRGGGVYFRIKKKRRYWFGWYYVVEEYCGYGDIVKIIIDFETYKQAISWIEEDIKIRMNIYNEKVVRIDEFEPLERRNKYLEEMLNLIKTQ